MTEPVATIVETQPCIIRANRHPVHIPGTTKAEYPELSTGGPTEYDLNKVEKWLHDGQKDGRRIAGYHIREALEHLGLLRRCLRMQDLDVIQKKGAIFYREHFSNGNGTSLRVPAWAALVKGDPSGENVQSDSFHVPALIESLGDVFKIWVPLDNGVGGNMPALLFPQ